MISLLVGLVLAASGAEAQTLKSFWRNRQGLKHLVNKMPIPAQRDFVRAMEDDPLNPALQLNLGLTYEANEETEKAEAAYRGALSFSPPDSVINYQAQFNLAGALAKQKKLDEAVHAYQECLKRTPESIEVKTNIELLFQGGGQGGQDGKDKKDKNDKSGKGQSKSEPKDDKKDDRTNQQKREQAGEEPKEKPKSQPKPFDSRDLSQEDVRRILDEIKNQEQAIRANEYEKNAKEAPQGKDW